MMLESQAQPSGTLCHLSACPLSQVQPGGPATSFSSLRVQASRL